MRYKSIYKSERKKIFFRKQFSELELQIIQIYKQNNHGKTNNRLQHYAYVKLFFNANLLIRDTPSDLRLAPLEFWLAHINLMYLDLRLDPFELWLALSKNLMFLDLGLACLHRTRSG